MIEWHNWENLSLSITSTCYYLAVNTLPLSNNEVIMLIYLLKNNMNKDLELRFYECRIRSYDKVKFSILAPRHKDM